jgi:hypothetical protein
MIKDWEELQEVGHCRRIVWMSDPRSIPFTKVYFKHYEQK